MSNIKNIKINNNTYTITDANAVHLTGDEVIYDQKYTTQVLKQTNYDESLPSTYIPAIITFKNAGTTIKGIDTGIAVSSLTLPTIIAEFRMDEQGDYDWFGTANVSTATICMNINSTNGASYVRWGTTGSLSFSSTYPFARMCDMMFHTLEVKSSSATSHAFSIDGISIGTLTHTASFANTGNIYIGSGRNRPKSSWKSFKIYNGTTLVYNGIACYNSELDSYGFYDFVADKYKAVSNTTGETIELVDYALTTDVPRKVSQLINDSGYISSYSVKSLKTDNSTAQEVSSGETFKGSGTINLHKVSKTGSYNDLLNTPSLASVATSGSYSDLSNTPTIDSSLSSTSTNAVQNKVINTALSGKQASLTTAQLNACNSGITSTKVTTYDGYASQISAKQDKLTAGSNITISGSTISATNTDTKNTAGSTNSTSKLYLIGATSQATNPQTYSNSNVYISGGAFYATSVTENGSLLSNKYVPQVIDVQLPLGDPTTEYKTTITNDGDGFIISTKSVAIGGDIDEQPDAFASFRIDPVYGIIINANEADRVDYYRFTGAGELVRFDGQDDSYHFKILDEEDTTSTFSTTSTLLPTCKAIYTYLSSNYQTKLTAGSNITISGSTISATNTDTKNTAGSTNSTSKLYLIGATTQSANPQTNSNSSVYATNGSLYATSFYEGTTALSSKYQYKLATGSDIQIRTLSFNTGSNYSNFSISGIYCRSVSITVGGSVGNENSASVTTNSSYQSSFGDGTWYPVACCKTGSYVNTMCYGISGWSDTGGTLWVKRAISSGSSQTYTFSIIMVRLY